nr:MAG TPA: hypothetical protein [Caudoviricetes sp.]
MSISFPIFWRKFPSRLYWSIVSFNILFYLNSVTL